MKQQIRTLVGRFIEDEDFRRKTEYLCDFVFNMFFALFDAICAVVMKSAWFGTIAANYFVFSVIKFVLLRRMDRTHDVNNWRYLRICSYVLLLDSVVLLGLCILQNTGEVNILYHVWLVYGVAFFTVFSIVSAILKLVWLEKTSCAMDYLDAQASIVSALLSLYVMQAALLFFFSKDASFDQIMSLITGACIFVFILIVGFVTLKISERRMSSSD